MLQCYLGQVHTIIEESGNYHFLVNNQYTGEKTAVSVDPDKISLFCDTSIFSERPEACPFFRYDAPSEKGYCTIHQTDAPGDLHGLWLLAPADPESGWKKGRKNHVPASPGLRR